MVSSRKRKVVVGGISRKQQQKTREGGGERVNKNLYKKNEKFFIIEELKKNDYLYIQVYISQKKWKLIKKIKKSQ